MEYFRFRIVTTLTITGDTNKVLKWSEEKKTTPRKLPMFDVCARNLFGQIACRHIGMNERRKKTKKK